MPFGPPDIALKVVLGEVASIITTGQRVLPAKALALGYPFKYPLLADALRAIVTRKKEPAKPTGHAVAASAGSHH